MAKGLIEIKSPYNVKEIQFQRNYPGYVYRRELVDDSEISPEEEGFMKGYESADDEEPEKSESDEESESKEKNPEE